MAVKAQSLKRVFDYNGVELPDPGAHMSPDLVRQLWAGSHPGLQSAVVDGPTVTGGVMKYRFINAVRDKGAAQRVRHEATAY